MSHGYSKRLFLLAFDHRGSFEKGLFGVTPPISTEVHDSIVRLKEIIFEANQLAVEAGAPRDLAGILVDEEFGTNVARRAKEVGTPLAMPVERSGQDEFEFQYGSEFGEHIESFDPTFVKVLVRYNPEGKADLNTRQTERLAVLSDWLQARECKFLFELLVPATTEQLDSFDGHQEDYDRHLRPKLVVEAIASLQAGGVNPDIWKVEGLEQFRRARKGGGAGPDGWSRRRRLHRARPRSGHGESHTVDPHRCSRTGILRIRGRPNPLERRFVRPSRRQVVCSRCGANHRRPLSNPDRCL